MRCKRVAKLMTDYVDGLLGGVRSSRFRDHLDRCDHCRDEEERARLVRDSLESVPEVDPPEDGLHRLETRLAFLPPLPAAAPAGRLRTLVLPYAAGFATAAAILLLALPLFTGEPEGPAAPGIAGPAAEETGASVSPALLPGERMLSPAPEYFVDDRGNLIEPSREALLRMLRHRTGGGGNIRAVDYEER